MTDDEPPSSTDRVVVVDDQESVVVDPARWRALAAAVLDAEGVHPALELTVTFVEPDVIAGLKAEHLGGDGTPTDVLAFPIDTEPGPGGTGLLGDVVVCPAVAASQAAERAGCRPAHDGTLDAELSLLVVHGILHLLGHDHLDDAEAERMETVEQRHLAVHLGAVP